MVTSIAAPSPSMATLARSHLSPGFSSILKELFKRKKRGRYERDETLLPPIELKQNRTVKRKFLK